MERTCNKCQQTFPLDENHFYRHVSKRDGYELSCKHCYRQRGKRYHLAKYDLTHDGYLAMLQEQDECCAICGTRTTLMIDHNHVTGKRRDLLCRNCNLMIGYAKDDPGLLLQAINYLREHLKEDNEPSAP